MYRVATMAKSGHLQFWGTIFITTLVVLLGIDYLLVPWVHPLHSIDQRAKATSPVRHGRKEFKAPVKNPWVELDEVESSQIYTFLHQGSDPLNLTTSPNAHGAQNTIYLIETLRPNKSDVVDYLDNNGPQPDRWARVAVLESHDDDAFITDYMVGPLPPSNITSIIPLSYCYNSGRNWVQSPISDVFGLISWALEIGEGVSDITQELLGATTNPLDPSDPDALVMGWRPALIDSGRMVHWLEFFGAGIRSDGRSLLPQGLYVKLDTPSPNPKDWVTGEWFYNGILYDNDTALRDAIKSPNFERLNYTPGGDWTDTEDFATGIPERDMPPPLSVQPYGPRYHLDRTESYVSWMGFSFYLSTNQATALSLFDIRYNSTRLIYHLGLQEALAHYAGTEPLQSGLEFLDTFFGMGSMMFSLVPGVDCPGHAEYIDMSYHKGGKMYTNRNAICVFEYTSDAPLQRHTSAYSVSVSRNTYLVVRSVSTVGNYDYTIDYIFYLDGSIEVKVRASGFIFGAFHAEPRSSPLARDENTNEYGYRIHPAIHTSMHDHVISFRADFDICAPKNTLVRTSIEPLQKTYHWDKPEVSGVRNTMHMVHEPVKQETGLDWPKNGGEMYLITNPNATNKWGETRAYRILPGTGMSNPSHLTILNSTTLGRSAAWSTSDLWVLKNHPDTEPFSAHHLNYIEPLNPLVDFANMVDGEDIEEEDLVFYFNLGGHHVPTSQDIPNTLMHTSASSVLFMPFNYFDEDVSRAVRQGVRIDRRPEKKKKDKNNGDKEEIRKSRHMERSRGSREEEEGETRKHEEVSYFGAHYTSPVTIEQEMLSPDLSHYMKERDDGEVGGWKTVRNNVGGGLLGLFVGKERGDEDDGRDRWDW
jgi:primary-amine oxidase